MVERQQTVFLLVLITAGAVCIGGGCSEKNEYVAPPPPEVTVARPLQQSVTNYVQETGTTEAVDRATVRARVQGFVEEIRFVPGQEVKSGDTLFLIEKDVYEAAKNAADAEAAIAEAAILVAEAKVKTVETEIERSRLDFERQKTLLETNATSQQDYDLAKATWETAKANLESAKATVVAAGAEKQRAEAKVAQAQLDLGYTTVVAPLAGRITKTAVKRGNLVQMDSELASVVDDSRLYANFNLSDREAMRISREARAKHPELAEMTSEEIWSEIEVELRTELDASFTHRGRLEYVDQEGVDRKTGTLALRAVFDNSDDALLPGLFVYLRIPGEVSENAILVPQGATIRDQQGTFVLIVGPDQKVERRAVTLGPETEGWVVVEEGLAAAELLIVDGLQRARPGNPVQPTETTLERTSSESTPPAAPAAPETPAP